LPKRQYKQGMEFNYFELKNGIRIIHKHTESEVAHCGFIINTGSRDENLSENGMTHFIEHTIFKGTSKRKAFHILNRLDNVGGEINAYTTKENTCVYASFTRNYFDRATELLSDILFNSIYPKKELEKEKEVVIDEIQSYFDSPYEQIYDDFEEMVFANHPLSMNILGTAESVKKISRENILDFIEKNYNTNEIIFSVVANIPFKKIIKIAEKQFGHITSKSSSQKIRKPFTTYKPIDIKTNRDSHQVHFMMGNTAYSSHHKDKNSFVLLNNILGGPAMNSRLNIGIREKYGFAYNIESSYTTYSDTGLFNLYLGTDQKNIDKCNSLVIKELRKLKTKKLSTLQLHRAKQQLIGQITLSEENNSNVMLGMGKSILLYNKVDELQEIYEKINKISAEELIDIANDVFDENQLSTLTYQSNKN